MSTYKDLIVYQSSFQLALEIYRFTRGLPNEYKFDISDDIRRASRSIPSNIAEGYARNKSDADTLNFLRTSIGSNDEVLFNLDFIYGLELISQENYLYFKKNYKILGVGLRNLINSFSKKKS